MKAGAARKQAGLSLSGFIVVIAIFGVIAVIAMKVVPTVTEFSSIKKAIAQAKSSGTTPAEIKSSFDRQASAGYIESISGKDLEVIRTADGHEVNVAYEKKIPLVGPVSLVIDYVASTSRTPLKKAE